jgi:hypothetical protein
MASEAASSGGTIPPAESQMVCLEWFSTFDAAMIEISRYRRRLNCFLNSCPGFHEFGLEVQDMINRRIKVEADFCGFSAVDRTRARTTY